MCSIHAPPWGRGTLVVLVTIALLGAGGHGGPWWENCSWCLLLLLNSWGC